MFSLPNIHDVQKKFLCPLCRTEGAKSHRSECFEIVLLCWIFFLIYLKFNPSILCSCKSLKPPKKAQRSVFWAVVLPREETALRKLKLQNKFEPSPMKTRALMAGEITGGISPPHAIGQQQYLPWDLSSASLAHSSMETSIQCSLPCTAGPLGTSPGSQLPWGAAVFYSPTIIASLWGFPRPISPLQ